MYQSKLTIYTNQHPRICILLLLCSDSFVIISLLYHRKDRATRTTHTQGFVLCDVDDSQHIGRRESFIRCVRGGFVCWSGSLPKGYYDIIPFSTSFWRDEDKSRKFTLVIQSDINLHLSMKNKAPTYLTDFLIVAGMKISKHQRIVRIFSIETHVNICNAFFLFRDTKEISM